MTIALTRLTFGFQVLFERLCEWETLIPKVTPFPQMSHFAINLHLLAALTGTEQNYFIRLQWEKQYLIGAILEKKWEHTADAPPFGIVFWAERIYNYLNVSIYYV